MSIALLSADLSGMPDRDQVVAELHEFAKPIDFQVALGRAQPKLALLFGVAQQKVVERGLLSS